MLSAFRKRVLFGQDWIAFTDGFRHSGGYNIIFFCYHFLLSATVTMTIILIVPRSVCRKRQRAMGLRNNTKVIVSYGFADLPECSSCAGFSPERRIAHLRSSQYHIPFGRSFSCILTRQKAKSHKALPSTSKG